MIEEHEYHENEPPRDVSLPASSDEPPAEAARSTQTIPPQSTLHSLYNIDLAKPRLPRIKHHSLLGEESIAFYIGELDDPLIVQVKDRITLGRYGPYSSQPSVDLAPYGAFERGVSRLHGTIYRQAGALFFEDMDSNNGSYINAERIAPQVPHQLRSGDVIVLGSLTLEIYFKSAQVTAEPSAPSTVVEEKQTTKDMPWVDGPRVVQAIKGTVQFSAENAKEPAINAELVLYVKQDASARHTLEIAISGDVDASEEKVKELLERLAKSSGFELTLR